MSALQNATPARPGAGYSVETATATAVSDVLKKEFTAEGSAIGPACAVQGERAVGTATVQSSFLQQVQPSLAPIEQSLNALAAAESEVAAKKAAAAAALQQAGQLAAQAQVEARRAEVAKEEARLSVAQAEHNARLRLMEVKQLKEAQALHDKICAELAAKGAAQAKAAEGSHLSAARAAAQEAAEAEAIIQAARAKLAAAQKAQQQLQEQAAMEKAWAAAETQHAASLTASSEAHRREAVMAAEHVGAMQQQLGQVQTQLGLGAIQGMLGGTHSGATMQTTAVGGSAASAGLGGGTALGSGLGGVRAAQAQPVGALAGRNNWQCMQCLVPGPAPPGTDFTHYLAVRIHRADLQAAAPSVRLMALRLRCGPAEARSDRLLDAAQGGSWRVEGLLPVYEGHVPAALDAALLRLDLLDATPFAGAASAAGGAPGGAPAQVPYMQSLWQGGERVLGSAGMRIITLADGHVSRNNMVELSNGVRLWVSLQLCAAQPPAQPAHAAAGGAGLPLDTAPIGGGALLQPGGVGTATSTTTTTQVWRPAPVEGGAWWVLVAPARQNLWNQLAGAPVSPFFGPAAHAAVGLTPQEILQMAGPPPTASGRPIGQLAPGAAVQPQMSSGIGIGPYGALQSGSSSGVGPAAALKSGMAGGAPALPLNLSA